MDRAIHSRGILAGAIAVVTAILLDGSPRPAVAHEGVNLAGTWSGGGRVTFSTGNSERARCRATFHRQTPRTFGMNALCATPSARASQVAQLQQVSANSFEGRFYNREYDVSGTIRVSVSGKRLTALLRGGGASASLSLSR